jgi:hypothetical protein
LENAGHTRVGVLPGAGTVAEEYGLVVLNGADSADFAFVGWIGSAASWVTGKSLVVDVAGGARRDFSRSICVLSPCARFVNSLRDREAER